MLIAPQDTTIAAIGILLLGIVVGAVAAWLVLPSRRQLRRVVSELDSLRSEHAAYRSNVTQHFEQTSKLVANMTASYKAVYDHLATGAESLCDNSKVLEAGEFGAPRLVFDPRVDIERLEKESAREEGEQPAARSQGAAGAAAKSQPPSGRSDTQEGPVLEMTKAASANPPAEDEETALEEKQENDERPSIH